MHQICTRPTVLYGLGEFTECKVISGTLLEVLFCDEQCVEDVDIVLAKLKFICFLTQCCSGECISDQLASFLVGTGHEAGTSIFELW
jgi:hypothetical protein